MILVHCKQLLELNGGCIVNDVNKQGKLAAALRTAVVNGEGNRTKIQWMDNALVPSFQ
jgi:hypothetical protein